MLLDTSSMTLAQVVEEILKIVRENGYKADGGTGNMERQVIVA